MSIFLSPLLAKRLTLGTAVTALLLLVTLHILRPEIDTAQSMVSEYAIGKFGWMQTLVFLFFAVSAGALLAALHSEVKTFGGKIGLFFLILAAGGFFLGGIFNLEHPLHQLVFFIGAPSMAIACALISFRVARNPAWAQIRQGVVWAGQLPWISFVLNMSMFFIAFSPNGEFNPNVPVGWANRLFWLSSGVWLILMAWHSAKVSKQKLS
jgi:hypothetical membrane protein